MLTEKIAELEARLLLVERELERVSVQNQDLQRMNRRRKLVTKVLCLFCLFLFTLSASLPPPSAEATKHSAQRPVTRLEAPVLVVDSAGNSIVEVSGDQGKYGLTVYGPQGEGLFFGSAKSSGAGIIHVYGPGRKLLSLVNHEGFTAYNSTGKAVAALGARPGGSGFMTLGNANGDGIVEAGMTQDARGIVRAYPLGGPPPTVIPTAIMGGKPK